MEKKKKKKKGTNAFGLCDRAAALAQFLEHAPGAFSYIASVYCRANAAYVNGERIDVTRGARQGDPLSTFVYALAREFPRALILSYIFISKVIFSSLSEFECCFLTSTSCFSHSS